MEMPFKTQASPQAIFLFIKNYHTDLLFKKGGQKSGKGIFILFHFIFYLLLSKCFRLRCHKFLNFPNSNQLFLHSDKADISTKKRKKKEKKYNHANKRQNPTPYNPRNKLFAIKNICIKFNKKRKRERVREKTFLNKRV